MLMDEPPVAFPKPVALTYQIVAASEQNGQSMATVQLNGAATKLLRRAGVSFTPAKGDGRHRSRPSFTFQNMAGLQVGEHVRLNFTELSPKKAQMGEIERAPTPGQMRSYAGDFKTMPAGAIGSALKIITAARPR